MHLKSSPNNISLIEEEMVLSHLFFLHFSSKFNIQKGCALLKKSISIFSFFNIIKPNALIKVNTFDYYKFTLTQFINRNLK